jgi:hypothetical protein
MMCVHAYMYIYTLNIRNLSLYILVYVLVVESPATLQVALIFYGPGTWIRLAPFAFAMAAGPIVGGIGRI